jgi:predicted nuclease of restriction endonuclease-like (RecB) superfamily
VSEERQMPEASFQEITELIQSARQRAYRAVNMELVNLYWQVGQIISRRVTEEEWGKKTIQALGDYIRETNPGIRGFSAQNLWRMRQFYEAYQGKEILSPLVRELPWTHHMLILAHSKLDEEREFYICTAIREKWSKRELERQLKSGLFLRSVASPPKVAPLVRELYPLAESVFKDSYALEFLGLSELHDEADLHGALLRNLGRFLTELGRDFCYVGSEYPLQVGSQDFSLDLLLFHRGLNALVAIELKAGRFEPEHLGKLNFYLEALERDHRKEHENPPVGMLLCASKDEEVVEYALSRSLSPAMVADYQTKMPDKELLKAKLHEMYQQLAASEDEGSMT